MQLGRIPWMAIDEYCDRKRYDDDTREDMHFYIRALDVAYLKYNNRKAKERKDAEAAKRRGKRTGRGRTDGDE